MTDLAIACGGGLVGAGDSWDLNGDGLPDVIASDSQTGLLYVFLAHAGAASYGAPALVNSGLPPYSLSAQDFALGDLNADGQTDVVVTGPSGTSLLLNGCMR